MTRPHDQANAQPQPDSRGEGGQDAYPDTAAAPGARPPGMPRDPHRGKDLDAATGTLVGAGLGALIWGGLILLYIWLR